MFLHTVKEDPRDAEVISHKLMLRAGMIRKLASGIYSYTPYGLKALKNVEAIIRQEMDSAGAQEVLMPAVQPAEIWKESRRWDVYGKELLRFKDRKGAEFALGPTHEEVVTDMVRGEIRSYKDLPVTLYQIQAKFRDEIRPRFGIMRSREFIMKDAYSFDRDEVGANESYDAMYHAYERIFTRCGLEFKAVEADSGPIGGNFSHEFMVLASTGEDVILSCSSCPYAANIEKAEIAKKDVDPTFRDAPAGEPEKVHTPDVKTVDEVCAFLDIKPHELVKTMIYTTEKGPVAVLVQGDHEVNEAKLKRMLQCTEVELADDQAIKRCTSAPRGFAGPVGLSIKIVADAALTDAGPYVTGSNEKDHHLKGVWLSRDCRIDGIEDLRNAQAGDACPRCGSGDMEEIRGIEVGHVFKLGTKYSDSMHAEYLDEGGILKPMIMGCYGIGVSRVLAAAIEQHHDENGIIFPVSIAPYTVMVLPVNIKSPEVMDAAKRIYDELRQSGISVMIDDRDLRPGVKFKDSELLGIPCRVTVGSKGLKEGVVEIKDRISGHVERIAVDKAHEHCLSMIKA